ncbi:ferric reductase-like transmembrane domain-containing protein [Microbacterium sp. LjRoot45]|uniref:ferredoxin reductase family protein n=1 Tax=Microbacterium sp. LjRoot45 TaxID=3342329 RepID=UPI003ECCC88E
MTTFAEPGLAPSVSTAPTASPASPTATTDRRRAQRARWRLLAVSVIWGTSLFVAALWVSGGGIQSLLSWDAEALNSLGRITGLVSANLLLYQVLLMARVPLFERGLGRDTITRMHRWTGFWSFWLLMAHIALLAIGYAAQAGLSPLVQLWTFVWDYPGMLLATAGTLLLVLVVVTSIRRARRRLRYESWHLLHLYGYLGVGLAVPHMLWTGADFLANPAATVYWWGVWALTAAAVIVFRVIAPLYRSMRHGIRVVSVERDGRRGVVVRMRGRNLERLGAEGGQFFVWRFLDGPGWTRGNPLSLAATPHGGELVIAARMVGEGTRRLARLAPGTRVLVEGPYGHLTGAARHGRKLLMIGAGAGVAPLLSVLESEQFAPGEAVLLTRDHDADDRTRADAVRTLVASRGVRHLSLDGPRRTDSSTWMPASHRAWRGSDLLRRAVPGIEDFDVFLCGPDAWMASLRADLRGAGVPRERIHTESFAI